MNNSIISIKENSFKYKEITLTFLKSSVIRRRESSFRWVTNNLRSSCASFRFIFSSSSCFLLAACFSRRLSSRSRRRSSCRCSFSACLRAFSCSSNSRCRLQEVKKDEFKKIMFNVELTFYIVHLLLSKTSLKLKEKEKRKLFFVDCYFLKFPSKAKFMS